MKIVDRRTEWSCPWLAVEARDVDLGPPRGRETFYSVRTQDFATVLAVTVDGRIPLVRQFRPSLDEWTLELPSGIVDPGEDAEAAIRRELYEETGCRAGEVRALGPMFLDSGRMQARQHVFFAPGVEIAGAPSGEEQELEALFPSLEEARDLIAGGRLRIGAHLGVFALAATLGLIDFRPSE